MKFSFGQNWLSYARVALDENRVAAGRADFRSLTEGIELRNRRFLDIGFGQGLTLFLAAEAGADACGLDPDPLCAEALAATGRFFPGVPQPRVTVGSILDEKTVGALASAELFDIVHSWGALHHTGDMRRAFAQTARLVRAGGFLILAIYNRHWTSPIWQCVKWVFNHLPRILQDATVTLLYPLFSRRARQLAGPGQVTTRGMELRHDLRDWLGGYPYEYASEQEVKEVFTALGFDLVRFVPTRGLTGCNEFVLRKNR